MKIYKGLVENGYDMDADATIPVLLDGDKAVNVTNLSPQSNRDGGFFSQPTPGSQVLILDVGNDDDPTAVGYYCLGAIVGTNTAYGKSVDESKLSQDWANSPQNVESMFTKNSWLDEKATVDETSLGKNDPHPPNVSPEAAKAWKAKQIAAEKQVWEDPAGNAVILSHASRIGGAEGYIDYALELKSGAGKYLKFSDSPGYNLIEMCPDKQQINTMVFAGAQTGAQSEKHTFQNGEFRLNTLGPINALSRLSSISLEVDDGYNIDISNHSTGDGTYKSKGKTTQGGAHSTYSSYNTGPYADLHPHSHEGEVGDPNDLGDESTGCVNITSDHNNITLNAHAPDSVIYINTTGSDSKITISSEGSVDVIAEGAITLGSNTKITLNAPVIDLNSAGAIYMD